MDILTSLIIIPLLTVLTLLFTKGLKNVRVIAAIGMTIQLLQSIRLVFIYLAERASGNDSEMILQKSYQWFESINIQYNVGVDGISVLMISSKSKKRKECKKSAIPLVSFHISQTINMHH